MNLIFLDIETIPTPEALKDANYTGEQIIEVDTNGKIVDTEQERLKKLSLSAITARILCLGYAVNSDPAETFYAQDETEILKAFWRIAAQTNIFIGHNILDFDLKFIWQRSVILGVKPSRDIPFIRFRSAPVYDTMQEWGKWSFRDYTSLDALTRALGIVSPKEDGLDGSKVYQYFLDGKIDQILSYCKRDVEAVRQIYQKLKSVG